jgi:ribonuclease-3
MPDRQTLLADFQDRIGHRFERPELLERALTHSSFANEHDTLHNERLEFLGDAVLDAVVVRMLFRRFPHVAEGPLSQQKHRLVCTETLAAIGSELGLAPLLLVGTGARKKGVNRNPTKLEDATEAVVGAVFLDAGFDRACEVVEPWLEPHVDRLELEKPRGDEGYKNAVSVLHERVARPPLRARAYPVDLGRKGTDHEPVWQVGWWVGGQVLATTWGTNKKAARRHAAALALEALDGLVADGWRPDPDAVPPESVA